MGKKKIKLGMGGLLFLMVKRINIAEQCQGLSSACGRFIPPNPGRFESNLPLVRRQHNESISKIPLYGFLLVQGAALDT